ncbi:MAG: alpha/beta hydrolase [Paracoccaceae bacterium]
MSEPLVFLPGMMADARLFLPQLVALGTKYAVQVILPTQGDNVEDMSQFVLDQTPAKFALIGHGLGGAVALDVLRRAAERVTRVVLISTPPLSVSPQVAAEREMRVVAARSGRLGEAMAQEIPEAALCNTEWRADVLALVKDMAFGLGEGVYLRQTRAMQRRPDQQKTMRRIKIPALIMAGEADTLLPVRRQEFTSGLMPYGKMCIIPEAGHLPSLEQPEAVSQAIETFMNGSLLLR